jgi:diguanylate cyclase (GGDEF)-like protein
MTPVWYLSPRPAIPRITIGLSLVALAIPMAAEFFFADLVRDSQALVWLFAVIPSFLLAYYRGWKGAATALAAGMAALSLTQVWILLTVGHLENWPVVLIVVVIFCATALANGLTTERLHAQRAEAELMALTDELTNLPNRRFVERFLDREFAAAIRGRPLTLAVFDIDNFKDYNDRFGHAAGDQALVTFAELLDDKTRKMDFSARHGGEEFLTVLSSCDLEGGLHFVERVRTALQEVEFIAGQITVSVGVAAFQVGMTSANELLAAADKALYLAKQDGRDCVRVASPGLHAEQRRGLEPA